MRILDQRPTLTLAFDASGILAGRRSWISLEDVVQSDVAADVTVDVALAEWLPRVTLICDFHIPNVPTIP
jgi:hypothetical protein